MCWVVMKFLCCCDGNFQDGFGCIGCLNDYFEKNEDENVVDYD